MKEFAGQENGETDYKTKNGDGRMRKNNLRLKKKKRPKLIGEGKKEIEES